MRKLSLLVALSFLLPFAAVSADQQVVEILVSGMVCEFCVHGVKKKLKNLDGIQNIDVSLKDKRARVVMEPKQTADIEAIRTAIIEAGFTPGEAKISSE